MARSKSAAPKLLARVSESGLSVVANGMTVVCDKTHHDVPFSLQDLPHNQKRRYRHLCAACAYEKGYADGLRDARDPERIATEDDDGAL